MTNRDFEIDMRMRADFDSARQEVSGTARDLDKLGNAAADASNKLNRAGTSSAGESRLRDMVRRSLDELEVARAQIQAEQGSVAAGKTAAAAATQEQVQAQQAYVAASRATQQAVSAEIGLISDLQGRLSRGAASVDDLADTEARLDAAMRKGLISADEYDEALEKLSQEQVKLNRETDKAGKAVDGAIGRYDKAGAGLQRLARDEAQLKAAVDAGRISREQYNRAMATIGAERSRLIAVRDSAQQSAGAMRLLNTESAGVQRNLSQLVSYGVTGQWQMAGNQLLQLGNQAGVASRLLSVAGISIAATTLLVGGLTAAVVTNYLQLQAFDNALIATGNYAGTTSSQLAGMRNQIGEATGNFADAQSSLESLTGSGKLASDSLSAASLAAVSLAELTGKSIEDTTAQVLTLAESPTAGLLKLNERYHFLTLEVYDNVRSLEEQGRAQDATKAATEALAQATAARVQEMRQNAGSLEQAWYGVRDSVRSVWQQIKEIGSDDPEARMAAGRRGILMANEGRAELRESVRLGRISQQQADEADRKLRERIALEQQNIAQWQKKKDVQVEAAAAQADAQRLQDKAVQAAASVDRDIARIDKKADRQQRLNRLIEQYNVISIANPNDSRLYDGSFERLQKAIINDTEEKKGAQPKKSGGQRDEEAASRELNNLLKQVAGLESLAEGETKVTEAARIRFEVEQGAYEHASAATKAQLLVQAEIIDAARASIEAERERAKEIEGTKRAYEQLQDALRTPAEAALDKAIAQVETLNKAIKSGIADASAYDDAMGRILGGSFSKAPKFEGLAPEVGGAFGELGKVADARKELETWYQQQIGLLNQFRAQKLGAENQWNAQEQQLAVQHQEALNRIESARQQALLAGTSATFGQLADIAKNYGGEQSQTYRALFAVSKGFAVAQAAVALAQNVAEASKAGFPQNIGFIAGALAQGATIASLLSQANYSPAGYAVGGRISGPGSGTSDSVPIWASNGEFMVRERTASQPGALSFLEDFNARGMDALYGWQQYADGGMVGTAPDAASPSWERIGTAAATSNQAGGRLRVYVLNDEDQLAQRLAQHPAMEKAVVAIAGSNGSAIRAEW